VFVVQDLIVLQIFFVSKRLPVDFASLLVGQILVSLAGAASLGLFVYI